MVRPSIVWDNPIVSHRRQNSSPKLLHSRQWYRVRRIAYRNLHSISIHKDAFAVKCTCRNRFSRRIAMLDFRFGNSECTWRIIQNRDFRIETPDLDRLDHIHCFFESEIPQSHRHWWATNAIIGLQFVFKSHVSQTMGWAKATIFKAKPLNQQVDLIELNRRMAIELLTITRQTFANLPNHQVTANN